MQENASHSCEHGVSNMIVYVCLTCAMRAELRVPPKTVQAQKRLGDSAPDDDPRARRVKTSTTEPMAPPARQRSSTAMMPDTTASRKADAADRRPTRTCRSSTIVTWNVTCTATSCWLSRVAKRAAGLGPAGRGRRQRVERRRRSLLLRTLTRERRRLLQALPCGPTYTYHVRAQAW